MNDREELRGYDPDPYTEVGRAAARLTREWIKHGTIIVGVDFDDTIYDCHHNGFQFPYITYVLRTAKAAGVTLCVWTANPDKELVDDVWKGMKITYDYYNDSPILLHPYQVKPYFNLLLDDRAGLGAALATLNRAMLAYSEHLYKTGKKR